MIAQAGEDVGLALLVDNQTGKATTKIIEEVPQKVKIQYHKIQLYRIGHVSKGLYILLQRFLLIQVHCCSIHNRQKLETA